MKKKIRKKYGLRPGLIVSVRDLECVLNSLTEVTAALKDPSWTLARIVFIEKELLTYRDMLSNHLKSYPRVSFRFPLGGSHDDTFINRVEVQLTNKVKVCPPNSKWLTVRS